MATARFIASLSLSFGLVNIPVRLLSQALALMLMEIVIPSSAASAR